MVFSGLKSGLASLAGAGFSYLMTAAGFNKVDNKMNQIIESLNRIEKDLQTIKANQQELKTLISDSFYNLHMKDYASALERSLYALTFEDNSQAKLLCPSGEYE